MSFRLFVYYCAVCGGWFALLGWGLGRLLAPGGAEEAGGLFRTLVRGLALGMMVAFGLGLVDGLCQHSWRQPRPLVSRALAVAFIGMLAGLVGAALGQVLYQATGLRPAVPLGWLLTGLLVGSAVGIYEVSRRLLGGDKPAGAWRKTLHGAAGGGLGGLLGVICYLGLGWLLGSLLGRPAQDLVSSSAWGFVALGACIGLFIGLAQVFLKQAWVRVEAGFRPGRELILTREETTLGRGEGCDIGLFGDPAVGKVHARILARGRRYYLEDAGTPAGTFLNDRKLQQTAALKAGDLIRVGQNVLRFDLRQSPR
jgi:hypothetical protein